MADLCWDEPGEVGPRAAAVRALQRRKANEPRSAATPALQPRQESVCRKWGVAGARGLETEEGWGGPHPEEEADEKDADDGDGDEGDGADDDDEERMQDCQDADGLLVLLDDHSDRDAVQNCPKHVEGEDHAIVEELVAARVDAPQCYTGHSHEHVD